MREITGLEACELALDRLIAGAPEKPEHVGVQASEITCSLVSVEAGHNKGYLKRSREHHKPIIARIDALRQSRSSGESLREKAVKAEKKAVGYKEKYERANDMLGLMLTENLRLLERIRELEAPTHKVQKRFV